MTVARPTIERRAIRAGAGRHELLRRASRAGESVALLDGSAAEHGWDHGPLLALDPRPIELGPTPLSALDRIVAARRGGPAETGVLVALGYDAPCARAWSVDGSVRWEADDSPVLTVRADDAAVAREVAAAWAERLDVPVGRREPLRADGRAVTSLPRLAYRRAVERVREQIAAGEIYQANVCQRFRVAATGDPLELYVELAASAAGPRAAYLAWQRSALVSVSPELFVRGRLGGTIETRPIKGTRPRGDDPASDRRHLDDLHASEKDHAELLMIVDLERNDLSRISEPGSVRVRELASARSYPTVHHLEARVEGRLLAEAGPAAIVRATFPGGSISGAPKRRAIEVLRTIEPVPRRFFTGSLFWFADDGSFDSSILIRTIEVHDGSVEIGAGGGVTWASDPEAEWRESNDKARALTRAVGFEPEDVA